MNTDRDTLINHKIATYGSRGSIGQTIIVYRAMMRVNHNPVREHSDRVALLAEKTAELLGYDQKAAFLGGMLHDIGKLTLPASLFAPDVRITAEEYKLIKTHAVSGFNILRDLHPFSALCAGMHHAMYRDGYGVEKKQIPEFIKGTKKVAIPIIVIISICDFIDAAMHRTTHVIDGKFDGTLQEKLFEKYPKHHNIVETALRAQREMKI